MEIVEYNGWSRNVRLSNGEVELIVTQDVGPRVLRFGFIGGPNLFVEMEGQQGGAGELEWMIRGGHRLWLAPERKPLTYELDNTAVEIEEIPHGVRTRQSPGPLSHVVKSMDVTLAPEANVVTVKHALTNRGEEAIELAPWALSAMAAGGMAVIPLPEKISHDAQLTHNQEWSLWGYTDLSDPRWLFGGKWVFFKQDAEKGPAKIGMAHREGWVGYLLDDCLFVKRFEWVDGATYPDGGVNFETFSNETFLELESLGPMTNLAPGESATHEERWELHRDVPYVNTEGDADRYVRPLVS